MNGRYEAIIFGLFGTLVDIFSMNAHDAVVSTMADILQIPLSDFSAL
ncbi:hypothetical protein [Tengunoibacter tsumagoiensis]|uniref:Uncharacterized protein n=1 Tax=Tengunoibacter tsumagoiensis TaxID=2014871 RepID=A0A402A041_9CHLR|nr:hypothetical protein [Tengunoibacter tsumagoiensis]GCE12429.1 hypothetical protein KTT_22880 [Tengunoibacter tsumagoiensis]